MLDLRQATHEQYLEVVTNTIPGWLHDITAIRTMQLLDWQADQGIGGSLVEIGVFRGRYLSILLRAAILSGDRAFGIDTFDYASLEQVESDLAPLRAAGAACTLIRSASSEFDGASLVETIGGRCRFMSIDGSHEVGDVFLDLQLADACIASMGLVAVDDFLNPLTLGVNEAVGRFLSQPRRLVPFAYLPNKLLMSRPGAAARYTQVLETLILDDLDQRSDEFRVNAAKGRDQVDATFFGHRVMSAY